MSRHIVALFLVSVSCGVTRAQGSVQISSGLKEPVRLWLLPRGEKDWNRPPAFLPRSGSVKVYFAHQADHWLVAKDLAGDEDYLGWLDLPRLAKQVPPVELVVGGGYVTTAKEMTRTVVTYVPRQEERKQIICERIRIIGPGGRPRYIWAEREVKVITTTYVAVNKLERITVHVKSLRVDLSLNQDGKSVPIGDFLKKNDK